MKSQLNELLEEVRAAYEKSKIGKKHEWFYSLITTPCIKYSPLIVGFNWGVDRNFQHRPQVHIKESYIKNEDLGSLARIEQYYWKEYLPLEAFHRASQTNYCFFRSEKAAQIDNDDLLLCQPIFDKLLKILEPSIVLSFSSKLRDYLLHSGQVTDLESKCLEYTRGKTKVPYTPYKGKLSFGAPIVFLPHPNYPLKKEIRVKSWQFCFPKIKKEHEI